MTRGLHGIELRGSWHRVQQWLSGRDDEEDEDHPDPCKKTQQNYARAAARYPPEEIEFKQQQIVMPIPQRRYVKEEEDFRPRRRMLQEFEVVRTLGKGAYGTVCAVKTKKRKYRSDDSEYDIVGAQMALKALEKCKARDNQRFTDSADMRPYHDWKNTELRILHSFTEYSPFVSQLFDSYADPRNLYLLSELGPCGTLQDLIIKSGPFNPQICQFFFANIVLALEFVHSQGVVHRDLKPNNLFLGADGYLMLGDFGVATPQYEDSATWKNYGTLPYGLPETVGAMEPQWQYRRHRDWWAAACILFEMATQRLVFPTPASLAADGEAGKLDIKKRIATARYSWPRNVEVDSDLKDLVDRMLVVDPEERYGMTLVPPKPKAKEEEHTEGQKEEQTKSKDVAQASTSGKKEEKPTATDHINREIRMHPFMVFFSWGAMADRRMIAPFVPTATPDLSRGWQQKLLPYKHELPFLSIMKPAPHVEYDYRFRNFPANAPIAPSMDWPTEGSDMENLQVRPITPPGSAPKVQRPVASGSEQPQPPPKKRRRYTAEEDEAQLEVLAKQNEKKLAQAEQARKTIERNTGVKQRTREVFMACEAERIRKLREQRDTPVEVAQIPAEILVASEEAQRSPVNSPRKGSDELPTPHVINAVTSARPATPNPHPTLPAVFGPGDLATIVYPTPAFPRQPLPTFIEGSSRVPLDHADIPSCPPTPTLTNGKSASSSRAASTPNALPAELVPAVDDGEKLAGNSSVSPPSIARPSDDIDEFMLPVDKTQDEELPDIQPPRYDSQNFRMRS